MLWRPWFGMWCLTRKWPYEGRCRWTQAWLGDAALETPTNWRSHLNVSISATLHWASQEGKAADKGLAEAGSAKTTPRGRWISTKYARYDVHYYLTGEEKVIICKLRNVAKVILSSGKTLPLLRWDLYIVLVYVVQVKWPQSGEWSCSCNFESISIL